MSKSATEQFQIKKKRKHSANNNNNNNSNNNNNYKSNNNISSNNINKRIAPLATITSAATGNAAAAAARKTFSQLGAKRNFRLQYRNYFALTSEPLLIAANVKDVSGNSVRCLRDKSQVAAAVSSHNNNNNNNNNNKNSRQQQQQQQQQMPLSQGYYAKGSSHATKRVAVGCGIKAVKVCGSRGGADEPKRKPSENFATRTQLQQQLLNNGNSNNKNNNNLQLSYLLGESLARHERLQEAFDIYAIIASEQIDGFIPLERLNSLTIGLINYVRQLSSTGGSGKVELSQEDATIKTSNKRFGYSSTLETTLKTKFAKQHAATWNVASATAAAGADSNLCESLLGAASLDLHAPTRELCGSVPSPIHCDDYDPLLCPLCRDILRCPVTTNCGHTFCRQCCETITQCNICHIKFPRSCLDDFESNFSKQQYVSEAAANVYNSLAYSAASTSTASRAAETSATMLSSVSTTTTTASTTNFYRGVSSLVNGSDNASPHLLSSSSSSSSVAAATRRINQQFPAAIPTNTAAAAARLRMVASPTTVTTTTVASTTATATTTMASTSRAAASSSLTAAVAAVAIGTADNMKFMPDVLVRRLVEKWWGHDLQAKKINETAASYMHLNLLDDALKFCNASLEKSPTNFKSLLLRAEVLRKLNHYQSSLADVESALKVRYTSPKAHYLRALTLSELGRYDEALYGNCLAISLDKFANLTTSELFQHDLAKILQKLLAQSPNKCKGSGDAPHRNYAFSTAPYNIRAEHRLRRKQIALLSNANGDDHLGTFDNVNYRQQKCDIMADEVDVDCAGMDMLMSGGGVGNDAYVGCIDTRAVAYASGIVVKDYELALQRHTSRKHFRRKWMTKETELLPTVVSEVMDDALCSALFRSILQRTQQEVQRLKKLESSDETSSLNKQLAQVPASLVDASDFDCVLCCRTFWKPVVTPCGHTYCWVCLDRCMDYTSSCPLCMSPLVEPNVNTVYQGSSSPVPFILAKRPVTKFLEAAMKRFIPDSYAKRFRQEIDMEPSVPVFICTTAFPNVPCPLFVYEPRYRLMVRRAVESGEKQFGIVQPHSGKSRYFDIGTILDIRDCVLLGDGCSILSTIGCKRFKILARNEKDGYETAKVEYIYDEAIADENVKFVSDMHAAVLSKAVEWFESLSTELKQEILQSFGEMPPVEENWESIADGPAWAWWIIALLPLSQQLKVDILATTSLEKRLRAIEKTLDYMSGNFRRSQQNCSVVVVQQQQHHQQQQQQQQQQCDTDDLTQTTCQTDECCQRTTTTLTSSGGGAHTNANGGDHSPQLML